MSIYGAKGAGPFGGYPSLNAYRKAKRIERLQDIADRIKGLEAIDKNRDLHFERWLKAECIEGVKLGNGLELSVECSTTVLYKSYCDFFGPAARSPQAWGRWMSDRFIKAVRNSRGVGRVYYGVALKPKADTEPEI